MQVDSKFISSFENVIETATLSRKKSTPFTSHYGSLQSHRFFPPTPPVDEAKAVLIATSQLVTVIAHVTSRFDGNCERRRNCSCELHAFGLASNASAGCLSTGRAALEYSTCKKSPRKRVAINAVTHYLSAFAAFVLLDVWGDASVPCW